MAKCSDMMVIVCSWDAETCNVHAALIWRIRVSWETLTPVMADAARCAQPDNWKVSGVDFVTSWINAHIAAAASLGKPLLIEEVRS